MFQVVTSLTAEHDWRLVVLEGLVCFLANVGAISLFYRAQAATGRERMVWLSLDAAAAGYGIWATHFIAMLAYDHTFGAGYDLTLTILSLLLAVLMTGAGFMIAMRNSGLWTAVLGGAVVGLGIAAMHFTGMRALELPGRVTWLPNLVVASVALGIVLGSLALSVAARRNDWASTLLAAVLLTLAVVMTHFTAMGAMRFVPDPTLILDKAPLSTGSLSFLAAGAAGLSLGMSLVATLSDRQSKAELRQQ